MISFLASVAALVLGYFLYGRFIERLQGIDPARATPAQTMADGVDFVPLPGWKIFLIQFLNIAGLGPIFGAVAGAMWGPIAFLWIVLGSLFAGGVHDYFSGMLSLRNKGANITELTGKYLGTGIMQALRVFMVLILIMVGAVFIMGPAKILHGLSGSSFSEISWVYLILVYYILSTILPIDKLIGRIYPLFGFALLFMALGITAMMLKNGLAIPELTLGNIRNLHTNPGRFPVFPMLFITIACGAVSGFHASQSPMMARCMTSEKQGRPIFYGAMLTEGVLALIWAAVGMSFYGGVEELNGVMAANKGNAAVVINEISNSLLGKFGAVLALLGVVAAPITSGDTAFRSARLIVADFLKTKQGPILNRVLISAPLFLVGFGFTLIDFAIVWCYFAWSNQTLAAVVLWTVTYYLISEGKNYWVSLVPATFMTAVSTTYLLFAPEGFGLPVTLAYPAGIGLALLLFAVTLQKASKPKTLLPEPVM